MYSCAYDIKFNENKISKILKAADISISCPQNAFVELAIALGKDLSKDYRGANLRGYPLYGQDLTRVDLTNADLRGADLRHAKGCRQPGVLLGDDEVYGKYGLLDGWEIVDRAFLDARRNNAPDRNQTLDFFDGAIPTWNLALCDAVPSREIVDRLAGRFRNLHDGVDRPGVTLLTGAGGEGKSTAALHLAERLLGLDDQAWTCARRVAVNAPIPEKLFADLEVRPNHCWVVVVDDADMGAWKLLKAIQGLEARTDVHFLLVARWADWCTAAPPEGLWSAAADFRREDLKKLSEVDAGRIVAGWATLGAEGYGKLSGTSPEHAAKALLGHARDSAARPEEGALLGALLAARGDERLAERVRRSMARWADKPLFGTATLRDVFAMIAVMHAENQLYLTPPVLARALKTDEADLEKRALNPLRLEAMLDGGGAHLLTRHRLVAETAVRIIEEDGGDPYGGLPALAAAAQKYVNQTFDNTHSVEWTFDIARHFVETRPELARKVAAAVFRADQSDALSLTALSQIHRRTGDPAGAFRALAETGDRFRARRDVLYEWGTVAGGLGESALAAWLTARSLADGAGELSPKQAKVGLAGLGVAFGALHDGTGDRAYLAARIACGRLGLKLPDLDATARGYFEKYAAAESERDFPVQPPKAALDTIAKAVVMAVEDIPPGTYTTETAVEIDTPFFERLLGEPDGYRFTQLLRHVEGGADAGVAAGKAPARAPRRRR